MLLRAAVFAALVVVALTAGAARAAPAAAATPCWKKLLNDWYDGRINHTYAVHCYRDALKHLPTDVQEYSSAHDDILRALQSALAARRQKHEAVGGNSPVPPQKPPESSGSTGPTGPSGKGGRKSGGGGTVSNTTTTGPGGTSGPGLAATDNASNPSSIPVPLLVLGGLAVLLLAAGGAGLVYKRIQARRS